MACNCKKSKAEVEASRQAQRDRRAAYREQQAQKKIEPVKVEAKNA